MNELYCDGGVININPSPVGGTWAFRILSDGEVMEEASGIITPEQAKTEMVTNNLTEMLALVRGIQRLPNTWTGTIYSDSQITLGRAFMGWKWTGIPKWLYEDFGRAVKALRNWEQIRYVLLSGHPTKAQLALGIGKGGRPVSEHNVWCDHECGRRAKGFMEVINGTNT